MPNIQEMKGIRRKVMKILGEGQERMVNDMTV